MTTQLQIVYISCTTPTGTMYFNPMTLTAYEIFHEKLTKAVNDTMPIKKVKINKRKLSKPWITKGLLTSIAYKKNSMYKRINH